MKILQETLLEAHGLLYPNKLRFDYGSQDSALLRRKCPPQHYGHGYLVSLWISMIEIFSLT